MASFWFAGTWKKGLQRGEPSSPEWLPLTTFLRRCMGDGEKTKYAKRSVGGSHSVVAVGISYWARFQDMGGAGG